MLLRKKNQSTGGGDVMRKREKKRGASRPNIMFVLFACCVFISVVFNNANLASLSVSSPVSKIQKMTKLLESSTIRYYVYDDNKLVLSHIRAKALEDAPKTWRPNWGLRFSEYAKGEIRWIEALERHPQRTRDPCEADFFVVPIPVGATVVWGQPQLLRDAFTTLLNGTLFQQHPERHVVAFATTEKVFGSKFWGLSDGEMKKFQSSIIVRDSNRNDEAKSFSHVVSLGYGGEGSNPSYPYNPVTTENWNKKQFWYFYHTRQEPSVSNSTQYRQFFLRDSIRLESFEHQPVSIGLDIVPLGEWVRIFSDSKFCLTIRGDQPGSRSLNRAIRFGCIPLVISDALPVFQSYYSKTLQYDDFALIVKEEDFLKDPIGSLDKAISLSPTELLQKLEGLRLMQRIVTADQFDSLFVPAFAREIVETMKENGFAAGATGSQCDSDHNATRKREIEIH